MILTGKSAIERDLVYVDNDVLKWRIRYRKNDIARIYLKYANRLEERTLMSVDEKHMTPGDLISCNAWGPDKKQKPTNFWKM